jgi:hypothetical protein
LPSEERAAAAEALEDEATTSDEGESGRAEEGALPLPLGEISFPSSPARETTPSSADAEEAHATLTAAGEDAAAAATANERDSSKEEEEEEEATGRDTTHLSEPLPPSKAVAAFFPVLSPQATTATEPSAEEPALALAEGEEEEEEAPHSKERSQRSAPSEERHARRTRRSPSPSIEERVSAEPEGPRGATDSRRSRASRSCGWKEEIEVEEIEVEVEVEVEINRSIGEFQFRFSLLFFLFISLFLTFRHTISPLETSSSATVPSRAAATSSESATAASEEDEEELEEELEPDRSTKKASVSFPIPLRCQSTCSACSLVRAATGESAQRHAASKRGSSSSCSLGGERREGDDDQGIEFFLAFVFSISIDWSSPLHFAFFSCTSSLAPSLLSSFPPFSPILMQSTCARSLLRRPVAVAVVAVAGRVSSASIRKASSSSLSSSSRNPSSSSPSCSLRTMATSSAPSSSSVAADYEQLTAKLKELSSLQVGSWRQN